MIKWTEELRLGLHLIKTEYKTKYDLTAAQQAAIFSQVFSAHLRDCNCPEVRPKKLYTHPAQHLWLVCEDPSDRVESLRVALRARIEEAASAYTHTTSTSSRNVRNATRVRSPVPGSDPQPAPQPSSPIRPPGWARHNRDTSVAAGERQQPRSRHFATRNLRERIEALRFTESSEDEEQLPPATPAPRRRVLQAVSPSHQYASLARAP